MSELHQDSTLETIYKLHNEAGIITRDELRHLVNKYLTHITKSPEPLLEEPNAKPKVAVQTVNKGDLI